MFELPHSLIIQGGAASILLLVVLLIIGGKLVPRRVLKDVEKDRDYWRNTALEAMKQNGQLIQGSRVVADVMEALPNPGREASP